MIRAGAPMAAAAELAALARESRRSLAVAVVVLRIAVWTASSSRANRGLQKPRMAKFIDTLRLKPEPTLTTPRPGGSRRAAVGAERLAKGVCGHARMARKRAQQDPLTKPAPQRVIVARPYPVKA